MGTTGFAVAGAGLQAGGILAGNKANDATAARLRAAGKADRASLGFSRIEQLRSLGRQTQAEQGAIRATTSNRGITGNTAFLIEQAAASAALFDQRNITTNFNLGIKKQITEENSRLSQLRSTGLLLPAISGALSGATLGKQLGG